MNVKAISLLQFLLILLALISGIRVVAATVGSSGEAITSDKPESSEISQCVGSSTRGAEQKEVVTQLKLEYREHYGELKGVHDRFMMHVTILVTIVSLIIPLLSWLEKREFQKEFETTKSRLKEAQESNRELKKAEARGFLATAQFTWVFLLHEMEHGSVQGYRIAEPLYWICNALVLASQVKDTLIMRDCVNSFSKTIADYNAAVKLHEGQHDAFKAFVVDKRFLVDSAACDLSWFFETKDKDYEKILRFFNDFGIKMFGEFS